MSVMFMMETKKASVPEAFFVGRLFAGMLRQRQPAALL